MSGSGPDLRPLEGPRSLGEDAADSIREQILNGGFQRGEHLVEARIAQRLGISRGPVREAFKLLRAEGLVAEEPRRGTFVVILDSDDVREIYDLRAAIEASAAAQVATRRDEGAITELRSILTTMQDASKAGDVRAISRADMAFHEAICRLSGNGRMHSVFVQHAPALRTLLKVNELVYSSEEIAEQHRPIVDAIAAGDSAEARALCEAHCRQASDKIAAYIDQLAES